MLTMLVIAALAVGVVGMMRLAHGGEPAGAKSGGRPANLLIHESSPYLLQHAHNPVQWHPWGPAAFEKAKRENKPIFLSVGYSTCHWCHVMEHESFERDDVAKVLNEHFICIKVDREERPDVDEQYMLATQLFTQRGGWPNSVWLTPDGRPWYAGTYFPRERFIPLLLQLSEAWRDQREQVEEQANRFAQAIRQYGSGAMARTTPLSPQIIEQAASMFASSYDARNGGLGSAPKFPPHGALALLLAVNEKSGDARQRRIITHTLEAMALGGIYDHVGGGFHRYSTDSRWFLPHFEKMLYDNAQLIRAYAEAHRLTGEELYRRVIGETFDWITREMTDPAGGFYSALDADSEGEEGKFYVWKHEELLAVLGEADGKLLAETYGATEMGNYFEEATRERTGANILYLTAPVADEAMRGRLDSMKTKLREVRDRRVHPHLDDKVLSGWNGLMIAGLARAGSVLKEPRYTAAAAKAADFVLGRMRAADGRLLRTWRKGEAKNLPGYLDDYAFVIDGLLELHDATRESRWLEEAKKLTAIVFEDFHDEKGGGFYMSSGAHDELLMRAKEIGAGGNIPSGNGVMARCLVKLAEITGEKRYADAAATTLNAFSGMMASQPHGSEALVLALAHFYDAQAKRPELFVIPQKKRTTSGDAMATAGPVTFEAFASSQRVRPGGRFRVALRLSTDGNYHIYAHNLKQKNLLPTAVTLENKEVFTLKEVRYPKPQQIRDAALDEHIDVHESGSVIVAEIAAEEGSAGYHDVTLVIKAQACNDEQCLAPETYRLSVEVTIDDEAEPVEKQNRHAEVFRAGEEQGRK